MPVARSLVPFGTSIFSEMTRLAGEHRAINLAQGFPDFDGPAHVKQAAIDAIAAGHAQYAPMPGIPALRQAIARRFGAESGLGTDPDSQVTVTAGCTEAIAAALLGLLNPGDEVVLFEPYYDSYRACVALAGGTPRFVTLRAPGFTFDERELRAAFAPSGRAGGRVRAVIVNTPHNPTGRVFTKEELSFIADLCVEHDAIALADEVYERLVYSDTAAGRPGARGAAGAPAHVHIASLPGMAERTITMSSLGKAFSLTGWKIGWAVASPELTGAVRAAHQFLTFAVSTPMQHAAVAALASPPAYFTQLVADYRRKRDLLADALLGLGFALRRPEGSYFLYADHTPLSAPLGLADDVAFCKHLIEKAGVAAIPPTAFYENKAEGRRLVRFAFCKKDETLNKAVEGLRRLGR